MEIKTKFNEGDEIFFISPLKKVASSIVKGYKIEALYGNIDIIVLCSSDPEEAKFHLKVLEKDAFPSKEELLKSL